MSSDQLREAYRLIREGKKQQAERMLVPIVRAQPDNADAWWLLANALEDRDRKGQALQQVLRLRPGDEAAQRMLDRLPPQPAPFDENVPLEDLEYDYNAGDPFTTETAPKRVRVRPSRSGSSPITIILALIGLLTVIGCVACLLIAVLGAPTLARLANDFIGTVTYEPGFATLASMATTSVAPQMTAAAPQTLPTDLQKRGSISVGETKQATVDTNRDDSWTFSADANEHVIIELYANDTSLDPHLYLYDPSGQLIADNDDIDNSANQNSRIDIQLNRAGLYTIQVSKFSGGGAYALSLREG